MDTWIRNGTVVTPHQTLTRRVVIIQNGKIAAIEAEGEVTRDPQGVRIVDAGGLTITPGLIDVHTHGAAGFDAMDATPQALNSLAEFFIQHGVTAFLATTITQSPEATWQAIDNVKQAGSAETGARVIGVHLEGPFISSAYKGAQPQEWVRNPLAEEYRSWFDSGLVRLISIAPELPGALDCIRAGVAGGIKFSAGHSSATYSQTMAAIDAGLDHSTHTFNGMVPMNHRDPGVVGAVLSDERVFCEMIADGIHLHPAVLKMIVRLKGIERTVLITDSIRATGLSDGQYDLGGHIAFVKDGVARIASGSLAGSTLTLDRAVANMIEFGGCSFDQALAMATSVPAASLGIGDQMGEIKVGADADLLLVEPPFSVKTVFRMGEIRFSSRP